MLSITVFSRILYTCVYTGSIVFYVVDMNVKQIKNTLFGILAFALSLTGAGLISDTAQAYKCTGTTAGGAPYYYKDGRCWEPYYDTDDTAADYETKPLTNGSCPAGYEKIGNTSNCQAYRCNGVLQGQNSDCTKYTRNDSKDKPGGSAPVKDDNSPVTEWTCSDSTATYDSSTGKCTKKIAGCRAGTCTQEAGYPTPKGTDTSGSSNPNANLAYCSKKYVSTGSENLTKERAACEAGQTGKDCSTLQGSEKTACEDGQKNAPAQNGNGGGGGATQGGSGECGGARTNLISCGNKTGIDALADVLKQVLQVLTVLIGIVAVGGIAYGAIMYASAQDNSGQTQKAIEVIRNVLIGVLLYGFMVVIINWLSPIAIFG